MKLLFTSLAFLFLGMCSAQIPNSDFEAWSFNGWNYSPEFWETDNSQLLEPVTQDLEAYQGMYAMKLTAVPIVVGKLGEASVNFPMEYIPPSLDFWVKSFVENGYVEVRIEFFNNENLVYFEQWLNSEEIAEWTLISIPLDQIEPVLTDATITVTALVGDFVAGDAIISVDAISFGESQSTKDLSKYGLDIFPNPAVNEFNLVDKNLIVERLDIISSSGQKIKSVSSINQLNKIDTSDLTLGLYHIQIQTKENGILSQKLVIRR